MATSNGVTVNPERFGASLYAPDATTAEAMSVDGLTINTFLYVAGLGGLFTLSVSSASIDHTTVLAVSGYSTLRWLAFVAGAATLTGDVTGTISGSSIATTLVKKGGVTITATGTSLMTAAAALNARSTLGVDILNAGANLADTSPTVQPHTDNASQYTMPAATLTANRTTTLGTNGVLANTMVTIIRRDLTAHTLAIVNGGAGAGTLLTFASAPTTPQGANFFFDGTNWTLITFFYVSL